LNVVSDFVHSTHIHGGHYNASWRGDTRVPFACPSCGYRADAVAFLEARGESDGVGASPESAERDALNDAYDRLLAVVHAIPCPRCGHHDASLLSQVAETTQRNARNRRMRRLLTLTACAFVALAIALAVVAIIGVAEWWVGLIGIVVIPVVIILALIGIAYMPDAVPMVLPSIPPSVHFEEQRTAAALPFRS
jgi:hypothetical protein